MRPIELNIEELVLHGFPPGQRRAIADAVELPRGKLLPVVPADLDRRVGRAVFLGHLLRSAVEHDRALIAPEVDLHALAGNPRLPLLHPCHEFLLGHACSFVSSG